MDFIKVLQDDKQLAINKIAHLVSNTVKARAYYKVGGWKMVTENLGDDYLNPNFGMLTALIAMKLREQGFTTDYIISRLLPDAVKVVNKEFNHSVVEYRENGCSKGIYFA